MSKKYFKDTDEGVWWCDAHNRQATHLINMVSHPDFGKHCCDPILGGIMIPCSCSKIGTTITEKNTMSKYDTSKYDSGDAWAEIELYRWEHGDLPKANSPALNIPAGLRGMAKAIEEGVTSGDMTPKNFPSPQSVVEVLRYVARHLK